MSPWGLTVIVSLGIALFSMFILIFLRGRNRKRTSNCFWKGFLGGFLITAIVIAVMSMTGMLESALIFGLPVALAVGSLAGLLLEFLRKRMAGTDFWNNC